MRSLGQRSVRVPTVSEWSRRGMKIYKIDSRQMPRYFRVSYHQKRPRTHFCREQLKMSLSPPRWQSRGQCPGIVVCDRDLADVVANHRDRRIGLDDFETAALSHLLAIPQIHWIGHKAGLR